MQASWQVAKGGSRGIVLASLTLAILPTCQLAALQCPDGSPPPCAGARTVRAAAAPTSVAVLYFDNASADSGDAYLADGITEEIISRLGEVGRLQVKSRYLVRRYRGAAAENPQTIGRQLAVASIVTGSVRRAGSRLRVTAEMVRTASGDVIWSERYDRADTDVLSLQEDLASAVATAITGRLLPNEQRAIAAQPTRNPAAWDHFLRGNAALAQRTSAAYARALAEYEAAARIDPAFSRALARIAYVYGVASWRSEEVNGIPPDSSWRLAHAAAQRAIRVNGALSDAWLALGVVQIERPESVAAGRISLERAITLDSSNAEAWHVYGWALIYQGREAEAVAAWHRAVAIEPSRPITVAMLGWYEGYQRRYADAERWLDSALVLDPGFAQSLRVRFLTRLGRGDTAGAREDLSRLSGRNGMGLLGTGGSRDAALERIGSGLLAVQTGDSTLVRTEVARLLSRLDSLGDLQLGSVAMALVVLGETDNALDVLGRVRWKNTNHYANLLTWPFDRLRGLPRYERLLDEWRVPAGAR
jgi:TolB-like protein